MELATLYSRTAPVMFKGFIRGFDEKREGVRGINTNVQDIYRVFHLYGTAGSD
jgi:hypothetical protein